MGADVRRIYGLPNHWECPCGCGDYVSEPLRWPRAPIKERVNRPTPTDTKEPSAHA